jgi:hypothetical protein
MWRRRNLGLPKSAATRLRLDGIPHITPLPTADANRPITDEVRGLAAMVRTANIKAVSRGISKGYKGRSKDYRGLAFSMLPNSRQCKIAFGYGNRARDS